MLRLLLGFALVAASCTGNIDDGDLVADADPDAPDAGPNAPDAGTHGAGEPARLQGITELHNQVRAEVGVGPMTWDPDLAAIAQAWAETCTDNQAPAGLIDHNPNRSDDYPGYVGENVYGSGGNATPGDAVGLWASEKANYDYDSNTCSGICGHYTQIVWADSVKLGCGIHDCPGLSFGSTIVCNYAPGGNVGGQRPY
jgi:pathogenesis-related protein 1